MKKAILLFFFVINLSVFAQNIYDTYSTCQYPAVSPYDNSILMGSVPAGYEGEYQVFLNSHPWTVNSNLNTNAISYKIEAVSFPFTPNCMSCQTSVVPPPVDRVLKMPNNEYQFSSFENGWVRDISNLPPVPSGSNLTNEVIIRNAFYGKYNDLSVANPNSETHNATLISHSFTKTGAEYHAPRVYYPHTVLKHTFYMHCGNQITDPIVDSFSFVLDHTRGMMRKYPFVGSNSIESTAPEHDIPIKVSWADDQTNIALDAFDYFPKPYGTTNCNYHIGEGAAWDNATNIRPIPGSLLQLYLGNAVGSAAAGHFITTTQMPGISHQYVVDRVIDLNIINPTEKVIYNPSEVEIDLDQTYNTTPQSKTLIFPSNYTFKTVQGKYPSNTDLAVLDPNNLYYNKKDIPYTNLTCDDVGISDGIFSYYYVKSGSTLIIEPCVSIYDTKIVVESGGTLLYDKNLVKGNFILENNGGTVDLNYNYPYLSSIPSTCACDCYDYSEYDAGNIDITNNQTWSTSNLPYDSNGDGIVRIAGTLHIHSNASLTINGNVKFEFGENGKIIVDRKGKLFANGTSSTDQIEFKSNPNCKKGMWNGIEVWGNTSDNSQNILNSNQGYLYFENVKIMDARNAIATKKNEDNTYHGGIIQCYYTDFINNYRDVEILPYKHILSTGTEIHNLSHFTGCKFLITGKLKDPNIISADGRNYAGDERVKLVDVKNVRFNRCLFENSAIDPTTGNSLFDVDFRGTGIRGFDAAIGITGGNTNKNTFKGFSDGIWLSNTDLDYITIQGTDFINNIHGVTLENTTFSSIKFNNFEIPQHELGGQESTSGYNKPVGLYLISATKFNVEENTFKNYGTPVTGSEQLENFNYGMVVNNAVGVNSDGYATAYKNNFQNFNINLQTELDNRGGDFMTTPGSGFMYKCNDFNTRKNIDVTVVGKDGNYGLIREQGACISATTQAGNTYTSCTIGGAEQLEFDSDAVINNQNNFIYRDQPFKLQCTNLTNSINDCAISLGDNSCLSTSCSNIPCAIVQYTSSLSVLNQAVSNYNQLLDGGNTLSLLNSINGNMSPGQLKNLLISKSPYLSDTVLIAMLKKTNPLPPGHIQQVSIANSPLTEKVLAVVHETNLPSGIKNAILSAQTGISARKEKEAEIDYYAFEKNTKELNLTQLYLEVDNLDSLKKIAQKDTSLVGLFKLMEVLLAQGDLSGAQTCRAVIISKEMPHISDRCKFLSMQLNLALQGKTWFDIDSIQTATLMQMYLNNPETAIYARNVLAMVKGLKYEKYPFDVTLVRKGIISNENEKVVIDANNKLKVYPNPASDFSTVEIKLINDTINVEFVIYNILGSKIYSQQVKNMDVLTIDNKDLNNGIYLYVLKARNEVIEKQKVIISK